MSWIKQFFGEVSHVWGATKRSPGWDRLRDAHIDKNPFCAGCAIPFKLEAHHIAPFHLHPELELEPTNLITLCRDCHWFLGHMRDWSLFNPHVVEDAAIYRERFIAARLK